MLSIFFSCSSIISSVFFLPSTTSPILWFKFWNSTLLATFSSAIESVSLATTLPEIFSFHPEHTYQNSVRDCTLNCDHSAQTKHTHFLKFKTTPTPAIPSTPFSKLEGNKIIPTTHWKRSVGKLALTVLWPCTVKPLVANFSHCALFVLWTLHLVSHDGKQEFTKSKSLTVSNTDTSRLA